VSGAPCRGSDAKITLRAVLRFTLLCLLLWLLVAPAQADAEAYRELVRTAIEAQEAGRYVDAYELFAKANALLPNARALRGMGVAAFQAGDYVQAILDLEAALASTERALDGELRHAVAELLARAQKLVGSYVLELSPADATMSVDGRPIPGTPTLVLAPGRHALEISAEGFTTQTLTVSVQAGASDTLRVKLERAPAEPEPPAAPLASVTASVAPTAAVASQTLRPPELRRDEGRPGERRSRRAMWGLLGAGAGLTVAATTMGILGVVRVKPIDDACKAGCTQESRARRIDDANLDGLAMGVNVAGSAALSALLASGGLWAWRRYSVSAQAQRHSLRFGVTLRF
jgi:hypothetical protein